MKVALLSSGVPSKEYPLNGIFAFDQARALFQAGLDVYFLSIDLRSIRRKRKMGFSSGIKDGVKWYNISIPIGPIGPILKFVLRYSVLPLYKKAFGNSDKPDILHAHFGDMGKAAWIIKERYNIPYVITEHSSEVNKKNICRSLRENIKNSYSNADGLIAVSRALAKNMYINTSEEAIVIPNIVQTDIFFKTQKQHLDGFRLVSTSNLIPLKRTETLINVIAEVKEEIKDIHLDIIGDGILRDYLEKKCQKLDLSKKVTFHGLLTREQIAEIYGKSDAFVLVSSTETFGVAYVEAMASGLPVIGTRCGGPEDFINEKNGILVDVDNEDQLKAAILYMYQNYKKYDSAILRDYVRCHFSPAVIAKKNIEVYNRVINSY